jgi:co-chaperonin GroES (HSP10)
MAKKASIVNASGDVVFSTVPTIKSARPTGNNVLIERLTKQELTGGSTIYVGEGNENTGIPQAYVLDIGPLVSKECGFKVGDRVIMAGNYTPVPKFDGNLRELGIVLPDMIKAVLAE